MPWWLPEYDSPTFQETLEVANQGLLSGSAFGRFSGRRPTTYTWAEYTVKNYLDSHGIKYIHNYKIRGENRAFECDFFLNTLGVCCEVQPLFHYKSNHPTTRRVMESDREKKEFMTTHGIQYIEIVVYDNVEKYYQEIERKLEPFVR